MTAYNGLDDFDFLLALAAEQEDLASLNQGEPFAEDAIIAARRLRDIAESLRPREAYRAEVAARTLGSRGGKKGGPARAEKLSAERRRAIARAAAHARWGRRDA